MSGQFPNQFSDSQPPVMFPPPKPVSNRLLWIAVGLLTTGFLFCAGFVVFVVWSFRAPAKMTAEYRDQRAPINGLPPESITQVLASPQPVTGGDAEAIQKLVDAIAGEDPNPGEYGGQNEYWHLPRFVTEMQNSGEAVGVSGLTRLFWIKNLEESVSLPTLSQNSVIVGIQPLNNPEEARVTVVSYWPGHDQPLVNWLYVVKVGDAWKLYDYRDVLDPASEAQYFALYTAASKRLAESYSRLTYDNSEIYEDYEADAVSQAQRTLAAFQKRQYPTRLRPLALNHTASFLVLYEQVEPLQAIVSQMDPDQVLGCYFYRARLELLRDDRQAAFAASEALMDRLGWHPVAALMAAQSADTVEQKSLAADWMLQSLNVMPAHDITLQNFARLAEERHFDALTEQLAEGSRPVATFVSLLETARYLPKSKHLLERLQSAAASHPALQPGLAYCQLIQAEQASQPEAVLESAAQLLREPALAEQHDALWQTFMGYALEDDMLLVAQGLAPEQERFLRALRDRLLVRWNVDVDWQQAVDLLKAAPAETLLLEEPETQVVFARAASELGEMSEAYRRSSELLQLEAAWLDAEDPPEHMATLLDVAATAALEENQLVAFVEQLPNQELGLLAAATEAVNRAQLEKLGRLLEWAAEQPTLPVVWQHYYAAQAAYMSGDWERADALLEELGQAVEEDERLPDGLTGLVYQLSPEVDPATLVGVRAEYAYRSGELPTFVRQSLERGLLLEELDYEVHWQLQDSGATSIAAEVGQLFTQGPAELHATGLELLADAALAGGQWDAAIDFLIRSAEVQQSEETYYNTGLEKALRWMMAYGEYQRLPELRDLADDSDLQRRLELTEHCQAGDAASLLAKLDQSDADYEASDWVSDPAHIGAMQRAGVWTEVNAQHAVGLSSVAYSYTSHAALFFDTSLSSVQDAVRDAFAGLLQEQQPLPAERFPGASMGWHAKLETPHGQAGRVLLIGYDGPPRGVVAGSDYAQRIQEYNGVLCVTVLLDGSQVPGTREIRQLCAQAGTKLPHCLGYNDYMADSWFLGTDWPAQLRAAVETGVNPEHPQSDYVSWRGAEALEVLRASEGRVWLQLPLYLAVEQVPVTVVSSEAEAAADPLVGATPAAGDAELLQGTEAILEADVLSIPCLLQGTRVVEDYGY